MNSDLTLFRWYIQIPTRGPWTVISHTDIVMWSFRIIDAFACNCWRGFAFLLMVNKPNVTNHNIGEVKKSVTESS